MFGALLALAVMDSLGWHWYLGLATIPLFGVLFIFPVSTVHVHVCLYDPVYMMYVTPLLSLRLGC